MRFLQSYIIITVIFLLGNNLATCFIDRLINHTLHVRNKKDAIYRGQTCWMTLQARNISENMDAIDKRYENVRNSIQNFIMENEYSSIIETYFIMTGAIAERENFKKLAKGQIIPAGLNLGGYCMLNINNSVLFFNRMKLRNDTRFHVTSLKHDLKTMVLKVDFSLNDLKLFGAFERSLTMKKPSLIMHDVNFGEVEFLLKSVKYQVKGPYRLINNRLVIDSIRSELDVSSVLMTYINQDKSTTVPVSTLGEFLDRLKTDLDKWIMDFFNDVLIHHELKDIKNIDTLHKYDNEKTTELADWMDNSIQSMNNRIRLFGANNLKLPKFTIQSLQDVHKIKLFNGVLRGLDTMHRRSIPTSYKENDTRKVDVIIGFSDLKVVYKYIAVVGTSAPPMSGVITLSANELTGHLALNLLSEPEDIDMDIDFLDQMKPESLTVDGAANRMIANFKHVLDQQITSIMTNTLKYGVKLLKSLPNCDPFVPGEVLRKPKNLMSSSSDIDALINKYSGCGKKCKTKTCIYTEGAEGQCDDNDNGDGYILSMDVSTLPCHNWFGWTSCDQTYKIWIITDKEKTQIPLKTKPWPGTPKNDDWSEPLYNNDRRPKHPENGKETRHPKLNKETPDTLIHFFEKAKLQDDLPRPGNDKNKNKPMGKFDAAWLIPKKPNWPIALDHKWNCKGDKCDIWNIPVGPISNKLSRKSFHRPLLITPNY